MSVGTSACPKAETIVLILVVSTKLFAVRTQIFNAYCHQPCLEGSAYPIAKQLGLVKATGAIE
jgi:hypothetical protein